MKKKGTWEELQGCETMKGNTQPPAVPTGFWGARRLYVFQSAGPSLERHSLSLFLTLSALLDTIQVSLVVDLSEKHENVIIIAQFFQGS